MTRVLATDFQNNIGTCSDAAMQGPVIITRHQRDRLVLISAEGYARLTAGQNGNACTLEERGTDQETCRQQEPSKALAKSLSRDLHISS